MRYLLMLLLAGCSGAVSNPPAPQAPVPISVLPSTAVLYSGQPTTFQLSGGSGSYLVTSSDQAVIPLSGAVSGPELTVIPRPVAADSTLVLLVTDSAHSATVQASLTVKPTTVQNSITITPSSSQCSPGVCTGGDAEVSAVLIINGQPIANSPVRFEVVSGNAGFSGQPSITTATDLSGRARATIQVPASVQTQTILLRITDLQSGSFQTASFQAIQFPAFFATPQTLTFTGSDTAHCASGVSATVAIFGGSPPYRVIGGSPFVINRDVVSQSGGTFEVFPTGCATDIPITILDSAGQTVFVRASNSPGTASPPPIQVSPQSATIDTCNAQVTFTVVGGTGTYLASPSNNSIVEVGRTANTFSYRRAPGTTSPATVSISFASGNSSTGVLVTVEDPARGVCS